ncbi:MAG: phosphoribosylanthranilate isomerase [Psychroserpens sp.]|jgi:phosphoribosylanthranilate isomerase|uniref:phosphoribosylanthranilate isomerase n=1 Tax=Psychroserpens sp. TaxID=2020870 RepID=UPI0039E64B8C
MKLKICGMKYKDNITEVAQLQPDYLGFIFYEKSSRFFDGDIPELPHSIKKVGVFVNASVPDILKKIKNHNLQAIQLHGEESASFCAELKLMCHTERSLSANEESYNEIHMSSEIPEIIKVFSIKDKFDFSILKPFEEVCDYFLFDTKGKLPGGNGYTFNWDVLKEYPSTKPFFLSGGIGLNETEKLKDFKNTDASKYCYAVDVNSKFEIEPGLKNNKELKTFKNEL